MASIPNQGMNSLVCYQIVVAEWIGAEKPLGSHPLLSSPNPLTYAPRDDMFGASDGWIASTSGFCPTARAVFICFWLQHTRFWNRGRFWFLGVWFQQGSKLPNKQGKQQDERKKKAE